MRIDLHVHASERSGCSIAGEEEMIRAAIGVGLNGLVFTDHHRFVPEKRLAELNEKFAPFRVFAGIEISTTDGEDVLVLGLRDEKLESLYWRYKDLHDFVRSKNGFMVLAHPFRRGPRVRINLEKYPVDAIESRSINIDEKNHDRIEQLVQSTECKQVWNSDAHSSDKVGLFHICLEKTPKDEGEFMGLLNSGAYSCEALEEELFEIVNAQGVPIGKARRRECHGNPDLIHPVVHVMVENDAGEIFLQKRSLHKFIQPGRWDTSVGGHMLLGEQPEAGAVREMVEELGVEPASLQFVYDYVWESPIETEFVRTYRTTHNGPFTLQDSEIDDGRFWSTDEIRSELGEGIFTPNFEVEFRRFCAWKKKQE